MEKKCFIQKDVQCKAFSVAFVAFRVDFSSELARQSTFAEKGRTGFSVLSIFPFLLGPLPKGEREGEYKKSCSTI